MRLAEEEAKKVEEARKQAEEERKRFEAEKAESEAAVSALWLPKLAVRSPAEGKGAMKHSGVLLLYNGQMCTKEWQPLLH